MIANDTIEILPSCSPAYTDVSEHHAASMFSVEEQEFFYDLKMEVLHSSETSDPSIRPDLNRGTGYRD
jgi:hypothetical protein